MVLSGVPQKKSPVTPTGIDPGTVRLVAQCLNHYANPGPNIKMYLHKVGFGTWTGFILLRLGTGGRLL